MIPILLVPFIFRVANRSLGPNDCHRKDHEAYHGQLKRGQKHVPPRRRGRKREGYSRLDDKMNEYLGPVTLSRRARHDARRFRVMVRCREFRHLNRDVPLR